MTDYYMAHKDHPRNPDDVPIPIADSIKVYDCGESKCISAHLLLVDADGKGIGQATISYEAAIQMLAIIYNRKKGRK